jgi:hypothetical protein
LESAADRETQRWSAEANSDAALLAFIVLLIDNYPYPFIKLSNLPTQ